MRTRSHFVLGSPVWGDSFFGRQDTLAKAFSLLQAGAAVNIYSLRRMGKTSLLQQIKHLCENDANWSCYRPIYVDLMGGWDRSLVHSLQRHLGLTGARRPAEVEDAWLEVERAMQDTERRTLLLIDEADMWSYYKEEVDERDLRNMRVLQQSGVLNMVVCTAYASLTDHLQYTGEVVSPFYNIFHILRMPSFFPQEAIELLTTLCARGNAQLSSRIAGELAHYVGHYPQMVQEMGALAFSSLSKGNPVSLDRIARQWADERGRFWLPTFVRLFEKGYLGISVRSSGVSREDYLAESLEAYGLLMRDSRGVLAVAPYLRDLLRGWYSASEAIKRLQALADSANRNQ